jgi:hypothetical protein
MKIQRFLPLIILCGVVLFLTACAAGPNDLANVPKDDGTLAGFWLGLWHGFIFPFTFIISLFTSSVHFYEVHNNGILYNLGFYLGAIIMLGGSSGGVARRRKVIIEHRVASE